MNHPVGLGKELLDSNWKRMKGEERTEEVLEEVREGERESSAGVGEGETVWEFSWGLNLSRALHCLL